MKKHILTIILASLAFIVMFWAMDVIGKNKAATSDGVVKIEVIELDDTVIASKIINFYKGATLQKIIEDNFDHVVFEQSAYGPYLTAIENYETPSNYETYLTIYVNGAYSLVGIGDIKLEDGMTITIKVEANQ